MEVVEVGSVSVDDAIEFLLNPDHLKSLVGWHGTLCFALARELTAPGFYAQLIENVATIDSTTRDHVAFVVFYGNKTGLTHEAGTSYRPYCARYRINGFSVSNDRDIHLATRPLDQLGNFGFNHSLGDQLRYAPSKLNRPALSQQMGRATRVLMERYSVSEDSLPCLLFVDANDPSIGLTVRLSRKEPLVSLYEDALRPISQEFAELSRFWKRRDALEGKLGTFEHATSQLKDLQPKLAKVSSCLQRYEESAPQQLAEYSSEIGQWRQVQKVLEGPIESRSVYQSVKEHPAASSLLPKLTAYYHRLEELRATTEKYDDLTRGDVQAEPSDQRALHKAALEKRLFRIRASVKDRETFIRNIPKERIDLLERLIWSLESRFRDARREIERLEHEREWAAVYLRDNSRADLEDEQEALSGLEAELRKRGHGDDVLNAPFPSAFSVIRFLHSRNMLGSQGLSSVSRREKAMRILFLAANPATTSPLDLEEELRSLEQELRGVKYRDSITLVARHAVRPDDLIRHVRSDRPNVIHFSGHGSKQGIILRDDFGGYQAVDGASLRRFLEGRGIDLVVFNSCFSKDQADTIEGAVKSVIGTTAAVDDEDARRFTVAFYRTLGDGLSVREAFRDGGDAVVLHKGNDVFQCGGDLDLTLVGDNPSA